MKAFFRFLYLNTYAILLISIGLGLAFLPTLKTSVFLFALKCIVVLISLFKGISILIQWPTKKKHYKRLVSINSKEIKDNSFETFMYNPCGRLLTKAVLKDLGKRNYYSTLRKEFFYTPKEWLDDFLHKKPSKVVFKTEAQKYIQKRNLSK